MAPRGLLAAALVALLQLTNTATAAAASPALTLTTHPEAISLNTSHPFDPIIPAYWTGYPHHRRTPFAVSPDGQSAWLAYLDASGSGVHVVPVDPSSNFSASASQTTVTLPSGREAGGLVAHNDGGFAVLINEVVADVSPSDDLPIPVLYRYSASGARVFRTLLGGPDVPGDSTDELASPDMNGDLVYSAAADLYAVYVVVTSYTGPAAGHYGDAIRYVRGATGEVEVVEGASSSWGCSHNTGIALEVPGNAAEPPFATVCAEDQGAIWLNTAAQGMYNGGGNMKISNEHTINGASGEPMGGMGGSYSSLVRVQGKGEGNKGGQQRGHGLMFAWVSRGAMQLTENEWMGDGYTKAANRTSNRNVAVAPLRNKTALVGEEATSEVGADVGDAQVVWVTEYPDGGNDCSNAHVAAFGGSGGGKVLVAWEEIADPICDFEAMGCRGSFAGTKFQILDGATGKKLGQQLTATDVFVAGDMVTMPDDGRICWPYVNMKWSVDGAITETTKAGSVSIACVLQGSSSS